jgi:hypothetical protein
MLLKAISRQYDDAGQTVTIVGAGEKVINTYIVFLSANAYPPWVALHDGAGPGWNGGRSFPTGDALLDAVAKLAVDGKIHGEVDYFV